jgi:hypothetical protein
MENIIKKYEKYTTKIYGILIYWGVKGVLRKFHVFELNENYLELYFPASPNSIFFVDLISGQI